MPLYRYKAINARGETLQGQMEAASETEVAARLQEQGHLPVEARLASEVGGEPAWRTLLRPKPFSGQRLAQFTRQLATLLGAGQPLDRALGILLDLPDDEPARRIIADVREAVRGGLPLSTALDRQHGIFPPLYVNMVRAGEAGGSLEETLQRLADYLERSWQLRGRVINALVYPVIVLVVVCGALMFLLGYVVPQFAAMFESLDVELSWFTRLVLVAGLLVRDWWFVLLAAVLLALWWLDRRLRDPAFRERFDAWILQRRLAGQLVAKLETARLARTLGTLLRNGVPLITALGISRAVLGNRVLAADIESASDAVRNGVGLAAALAKGRHFPRLALQMVQVGEESGELDAMLLRAADTFDQETAHALDRMMAALVPVVTIVLSVIVGAVILAVLIPVYGLTNSM